MREKKSTAATSVGNFYTVIGTGEVAVAFMNYLDLKDSNLNIITACIY